jgi:putative endopeptidase
MEKIDYNKYINKKWLNNTIIPDNLSTWSSVTKLRKEMLSKLKNIISKMKNNPAKILYDAKPNKNYNDLFCLINQINSIETYQDKVNIIYTLQRYGIKPFFNVSIYSNPYKFEENILHIDQSGIGMDRVYYTKDKNKKRGEIYKKYISNIFRDYGISINVEKLYHFEKQMAKNMLSIEERRNVKRLANITMKSKMVNKLFWKYYFNNYDVKINKVIIDNIKYYDNVDKIIKETDIELYKTYLIWRVLNTYGKWCTKKGMDYNFNFYFKYLNGIKKQQPRWKKVVSLISNLFPDNVGELYVKKYFSVRKKEYVENMCKELKKAFKENLNEVDWMSKSTKIKCLNKLNNMYFKVGYPNKFNVINNINVTGDTFVSNLLEINNYMFKRNLKKLNKKAKQNDWVDMGCFIVNAFYEPYKNTITIPAGIIQKPFFNGTKNNPVILAKNYGALGRMIGHEITHGFDDEGRKFNGKGKLGNWWLKEEEKEFKKRTEKVRDLYKIKIYNKKLNTKLTMGENIADIGGIKIAWIAFKNQVKNYEKYGKIFFSSYAKSKRQKYRKKALIKLLHSDHHSPEFIRINFVLKQFKPFHKIYNIKQKDNMFLPDNKIPNIW